MAVSTGEEVPTDTKLTGIGLAVVALAHLPMEIVQLALAVRDPAARAAPLALLAAAPLAARALRETPARPSGRFVPTALAMAVSWTALAIACVLASPWAAGIATAVTCGSLAYTFGGIPWLRAVAPVTLLIALTATPPLELGDVALDRLGDFADRAAATTLDHFEVSYHWEDSILRLSGRALNPRTGSALVHLPALLTLAAVVSLWRRRGPIRFAVSLATTTFWLVAAETLRVVLVVMMADRGGFDLAVGRRGFAFGVATALLAALLAVSTDQLLSLATLGWRWLTVGPSRPNQKPWTETLALVARDMRDATAWFLGRGRDRRATPPSTARAIQIAALAFGALTIAQPWLLRSLSVLFRPEPGPPAWLSALNPDSLPEVLAGFRREAATVAQGAPIEGLEPPRLWLYSRGDRPAVFSIRGPFPERPSPVDVAGPDWQVLERVDTPLA
ncbi:MAG: archaeosortase/exosortase family protein, partial [Isosphaeraceae bacterium]